MIKLFLVFDYPRFIYSFYQFYYVITLYMFWGSRVVLSVGFWLALNKREVYTLKNLSLSSLAIEAY